jgi:hypothetical protein
MEATSPPQRSRSGTTPFVDCEGMRRHPELAGAGLDLVAVERARSGDDCVESAPQAGRRGKVEAIAGQPRDLCICEPRIVKRADWARLHRAANQVLQRVEVGDVLILGTKH